LIEAAHALRAAFQVPKTIIEAIEMFDVIITRQSGLFGALSRLRCACRISTDGGKLMSASTKLARVASSSVGGRAAPTHRSVSLRPCDVGSMNSPGLPDDLVPDDLVDSRETEPDTRPYQHELNPIDRTLTFGNAFVAMRLLLSIIRKAALGGSLHE